VKKSVKISIIPSQSDFGRLSIQDTMHQVWDFFDLLSDENNQHVKWVLENASFNSPFVVTAQPVDMRTNTPANESVSPIVRDIAIVMQNLSLNQPDQINLSNKKMKTIEQLLERNTNGIDKTLYDFGHGIEPIVMDQNHAEVGLKLLSAPNDLDQLLATFAVQGYGSINGSLIQVGTYHNKPAVHVKEFNTGNKIWCQVDQQTLEEVEEKIRAKDVWKRRDICVQGMLYFDDVGKLTRIVDGSVSYLNRREVSIQELHDPDFSEGLSSEEYINRLRED